MKTRLRTIKTCFRSNQQNILYWQKTAKILNNNCSRGKRSSKVGAKVFDMGEISFKWTLRHLRWMKYHLSVH